MHERPWTLAGDLPAAKLEELLDPRADQRTKQHIEVLRCLGLVESVVIPDDRAERPLALAPTVASRQGSALPLPSVEKCRWAGQGGGSPWYLPCCPSSAHRTCTADVFVMHS